jgi:hypothetical protein
MPKLIDYPRTSYTGAWELAEVTDDTGGKCSVETAAKKLDRKVSGSFKAIIGSAVKFGLLTSKRELLSTTTLFKRIKHAYDKQEELLFHREAFLSPPLFTQICRKFRSRELPVQMLDIMLIREFNVEEINAQGVAKAFVEGCKMVGLLDENNIMADIDALPDRNTARRSLASPIPTTNTFRNEKPQEETEIHGSDHKPSAENFLQEPDAVAGLFGSSRTKEIPSAKGTTANDAVASLFGLLPLTEDNKVDATPNATQPEAEPELPLEQADTPPISHAVNAEPEQMMQHPKRISTDTKSYLIQVNGPGISTEMSITEEEDITLAIALLEKIRRQLRNQHSVK